MRLKYLIISAMMTVAIFLYSPLPVFAFILGAGEDFAVLGGSTVTNTGSSTVKGDLGVSPGPSVTGFAIPPANTVVEGPGSTGLINGPGLVSGTIHISDGVALLAQTDATAAWVGLKNMSFTNDLTGQDLGGLTLTSGVYRFDSSAQLTGPLTLDAQGLDNAFWNFQIGSTLTTASSSSVAVINPGLNNGVFWQVGSSATLGTDTLFVGNIIADQSITLTTDAEILCGRALALKGAVTMDTNTINALCSSENTASRGFSGGLEINDSGEFVQTSSIVTPEPATLALLGLGLLGFGFKKKKTVRAV